MLQGGGGAINETTMFALAHKFNLTTSNDDVMLGSLCLPIRNGETVILAGLPVPH